MTFYPTSVLLPVAVSHPFTYAYEGEDPLEPGQLVVVPFRNKPAVGVVWVDDLKSSKTFKGKLKNIESVLDFPPLSQHHLTFLQRVADYTLAPLGNVLKMTLQTEFVKEKNTRKKIVLEHPQLNLSEFVLSEEQTYAAGKISECIEKNQFQSFILDGITGSGKTEVYLRAVQTALDQGKQVLVLLPEIALTTQFLHRFEKRFGCAPLQWHSTITSSQRRQTWQAILKEEGRVVVGARSALFLPFQNLGLIIVDEEHDGSFKQEEQVIYNGRDMAVMRAHFEKIPIVLASATPSLETIQNGLQGKYQVLSLRNRHGGASLPTIRAIDMRQQSPGWLSTPLISAMQQTISRGEQVMLFLNRRGYAPLTLCKGCGFRFTCLHCEAALVEHRRTNSLLCHHCGYTQPLSSECPECKQKDTLIPCGPGVERVLERVEKYFPTARAKIITSDEVTCVTKLQELLRQIHHHEIDILIGTQILAKGHHFPMITLVGVVDADLGLKGGDLRCAEKTYQLLHQVAGRAGRESRPGVVLLQTFQPEHPLMQAIINQDRDAFVSLELEDRQTHGMPPFGRLASLTLSSPQSDLVAQVARHLGQTFPRHWPIDLYGPVPAPLSYVRGRHRWRLLLKTDKSIPIQRYIQEWLGAHKIPSAVQMNIDIDPYSFV